MPARVHLSGLRRRHAQLPQDGDDCSVLRGRIRGRGVNHVQQQVRVYRLLQGALHETAGRHAVSASAA